MYCFALKKNVIPSDKLSIARGLFFLGILLVTTSFANGTDRVISWLLVVCHGKTPENVDVINTVGVFLESSAPNIFLLQSTVT